MESIPRPFKVSTLTVHNQISVAHSIAFGPSASIFDSVLPIDPIVASSGTRTTSCRDLGIDVAPLHRFTPQDRSGSPSQQGTLEASQRKYSASVRALLEARVPLSAVLFIFQALKSVLPRASPDFYDRCQGQPACLRTLAQQCPSRIVTPPNLIRATGDFYQPTIHLL